MAGYTNRSTNRRAKYEDFDKNRYSKYAVKNVHTINGARDTGEGYVSNTGLPIFVDSDGITYVKNDKGTWKYTNAQQGYHTAYIPTFKNSKYIVDKAKPTPSNTASDTVITPKNNAKPQQTDAHKIVRHSTRVISRPTGSFTDAFNKAKASGAGIFDWNGKKYNTMSEDDVANGGVDAYRQQHGDFDKFLGESTPGRQKGGWGYTEDQYDAVNKVPQQTEYDVAQQQQQPTRLDLFTNNDIKNLGFNNYAGLRDAAMNNANNSNPFIIALKNRFGTDVNKWNQQKVEGDLGVSGRYHNFGGGDYGDMTRSMFSWIGDNNGRFDAGRTGSNGMMYSNSHVRDLFERPLNNTTNNQPIANVQGIANAYKQNNYTTSPTPASAIPFLNGIKRIYHDDYLYKPYDQGEPTTDNQYQIKTPWSDYAQIKQAKKGTKLNNNKMDDDQQALINYIIAKAKEDGVAITDQDTLSYYINKKAADDNIDPKEYIQKLVEEMQQGTYDSGDTNIEDETAPITTARNGAKLNFIKRLKGNCPEGQELVYYRAGGRICKACMGKMMANGGKSQEKELSPVDSFKRDFIKNDKSLDKANNKSAEKASKRYTINYDGGKKQKMKQGGPVRPKEEKYKPQEWKQETFHPTTNKPAQKKQVPQSKETPQNKFNKSRAGVEGDLRELESGKQVGDKCGGKLTKKTKVKKHYFGGKIDSIVVNDSLNRLTGRWR